MHLKCKKKKLLHFLEGGTWQGIGVFSSVLVFCLFGRKSDTFCDCFHFVLVWKPSWCLRETLGARREAGGPRAQGPEEAKPKVYVVLGVDPSAGALIKALGAGHFFFFFFFFAEPGRTAAKTMLCRMLAGGSCCSSGFSRRLFVNITVEMQKQECFQIFTAIYQLPDAREGRLRGGGR